MARSKAVGKTITTERAKTSSTSSGHSASPHGSVFNNRLTLLTVGCCILAGWLHYQHVFGLFENQRFFSHLSDLEREMSFRTEMGLYYSYYKTVASAPSLAEGVGSMFSCNLTEYPDTINVFRRFNLMPELLLGVLYRLFNSTSAALGIRTTTCFSVNRGEGLSPVISCTGLGSLPYFYVTPVFLLQAMLAGAMFMAARSLSGNPLGGLVALSAYFFNHGEATRVMWTPPLRESFAFPFFIAQLAFVLRCLPRVVISRVDQAVLCVLTLGFMLPWQFAQFALFTQVCCFFGLNFLGYCDSVKIRALVMPMALAHALNFALQFANTLLVSSIYASSLAALWLCVYLDDWMTQRMHTCLRKVASPLVFLAVTVGGKMVTGRLFSIEDDAHIFDLLRTKFAGYKDFHTMLYVCAVEFDFAGWIYLKEISFTLLLPTACWVSMCLVNRVIRDLPLMPGAVLCASLVVSRDPPKLKKSAEVGHLYLVAQAVFFMVMALLIMRLKLFATPALCLLTSLVASDHVLPSMKPSTRYTLVALLLAGMSIRGYSNLNQQWATRGEYSNLPLERLFDYIEANVDRRAVFAGPMPLMANLKLSTGRPIVNHPHYEDAGARERTKKVYTLYSRKDPKDVYAVLKGMGVNYAVLDRSWCFHGSGPGCNQAEIWDLEDVTNRGKPSLCSMLMSKPAPFTHIYSNEHYVLLRL